jgi:hypothetical protein
MGRLWPKIRPWVSCLEVKREGLIDKTWTCGLVWVVLTYFYETTCCARGSWGEICVKILAQLLVEKNWPY